MVQDESASNSGQFRVYASQVLHSLTDYLRNPRSSYVATAKVTHII